MPAIDPRTPRPAHNSAMTVRMLLTMTGTRDGQAWPPRGGTITLGVDEALHLIDAGIAEPA